MNLYLLRTTPIRKKLTKRISELKKQRSVAELDWEKEKIGERIAMLSGGIGVIKVGATTELELNEKRDRVDDALCATKAAIKEGIVPGGGVVFINALDSLNRLKVVNEDEAIGVNIIRHAIQAPLREIVANAGMDSGVVVDKVNRSQNPNYGYNARTNKYENLIESGIIDPAKVSRVALENAASIAGMFLTTECVISKEKE